MSHTAPKTLSDYRKDIDSALEDSFLRRTLDTFAVAYRANREAVFKEVDERGLIKQIADAKDDACKHMEELYEQFRRVAEERGVHVHRAATAEDANRIIASIARENNVKRVIKSKSMTAEEIQLNPYLEKEGFIVDETDLGEWIIQLRHEGPSHMVMPAIHLSRYQVADDFTKETGVKQDAEDIQRLVREAEAHASEDKKKQETIEARNHADSLIYGTEKSLNDLGDKVDAAVKSDVEGKIAALRKTMEGDDAAAIKAATEELAKASHKLAEQLYQQQAPNGGAQQPGAGANPGAGAAQGNNNDDVVDADFTEVKK